MTFLKKINKFQAILLCLCSICFLFIGFLLEKTFSQSRSIPYKPANESTGEEISISKESQPIRNPIIDGNAYSQGYILIVPLMGNGKIGLYNKRGYFEKIWSTQPRTIYAELIDKNKILVVHKNKNYLNDPSFLHINTGLIAVYNHEGLMETSYEDISLHHDISIKNPSRIFALSIIFRNMKHKNKTVKIVDDSIIEIDLNTKKIVKRLILSDYFPLPDVLPKPKLLYKNSIDLFHTNAVDYIEKNPFNGNEAVLITMRNYHKGTIALIDLKTNKLLWQSPRGFFLYPHDGKFTKSKSITVFDNGDPERRRSRVFEMNIKTNTIVWEYDPLKYPNAFLKKWDSVMFRNNPKLRNFLFREWSRGQYLSLYMSGAQKTNKGYLIFSGMNGNIIEVSKNHKTVWLLPAAPSVFHSVSGELVTKIFKARQYDEDVLPFSEESIK